MISTTGSLETKCLSTLNVYSVITLCHSENLSTVCLGSHPDCRGRSIWIQFPSCRIKSEQIHI